MSFTPGSPSIRHTLLASLTGLLLVACSHTSSLQSAEQVPHYLDEALADIQAPGLRVMVIRDGQVRLDEARGIRLAGTESSLSTNDRFHLGSNTKAMTALMVAALIDEGILDWSTTLSELFATIEMLPAYTNVTVHDLIRHEGGFPGYLARSNRKLWNALWDGRDDDPVQTRATLTRELLMTEPAAKHGEYLYSNSGYIVLASALESRLGKSWESLIMERLFTPLNMDGCGIGAPAQDETLPPAQPWGHRMLTSGKLKPMKPGPIADNPPALAPAGGVHCDFRSWLEFLTVYLSPNGNRSLLRPDTFKALLAPSKSGRYGGGWRRVYREWGDGLVLYHAGTNKRFYSVAWLAPDKRSAVMVGTNLYYSGIESKVDRLVGQLISFYIQDHYATR